jgi:hypothetical protein
LDEQHIFGIFGCVIICFVVLEYMVVLVIWIKCVLVVILCNLLSI